MSQYEDIDPRHGTAIENYVNREPVIMSSYMQMFAEVYLGGVEIVLGDSTKASTREQDVSNVVYVTKKSVVYIDKHGMIPLRNNGTLIPTVVDYFSGRFVRLDDGFGNYSYHWINNGEDIPDEDVYVYVHPEFGPSVGNYPYRSLFSRAINLFDRMRAIREDIRTASYASSNIPFGIQTRDNTKATTILRPEQVNFQDAAEAGTDGTSLLSTVEKKYNNDMRGQMDDHFKDMEHRSNYEDVREITDANGIRRPLNMRQSWSHRRVFLPVGSTTANFQIPNYRDGIAEEEAFERTIRELMQVPSHSMLSGIRTTASSDVQREMLNRMVASRREMVQHIFSFIVHNFMMKDRREKLLKRRKSVREKIESMPKTYQSYLRWMKRNHRERDHPILRLMEQEEREAKIREINERVSHFAYDIIIESTTKGMPLNKDIVEQHLLKIWRRDQKLDEIDEEYEIVSNTKLVFLHESFTNKSILIEMSKNGLVSPQTAAELILVSEGASVADAKRIASEATGISPETAAKLEIEKQKVEIAKQTQIENAKSKWKEGEQIGQEKAPKKQKTEEEKPKKQKKEEDSKMKK